MDTEDNRANDWGVLHRILGEDADETRLLKLRIRDVPENKSRKDIKGTLERAGRVFGEGPVPWGNHVILPRDQWLALDNDPAETITFSDLADETWGEKRVTLRLPIGLHAQLVKAAGGKSFNQFVTDALADAIGYADEPLEPALPRLAARQKISVEEPREKITQMSAAELSQSPFAKQFGEHLTRLAGLPPEQLKARQDAFKASPQWAETLHITERMKSGEDVFADATDDEIEAASAKLGVTPAEFREKMKATAERMRDFDLAGAIEQSQVQTAQDTKDTTLMLRDVFTGRAASTAHSASEERETDTDDARVSGSFAAAGVPERP